MAISAVLALLAAAGGYVLIDSNTGASGSPSGQSTDPHHAGAEFAECMRDQGIADFPDPVFEAGGGVMFEEQSDLDATDEELDAARQACEHLLAEFVPEGGDPPRSGSSPEDLAAAGWGEIVPGGDCNCSDGSEFSFYSRETSAERVVLFLDAGGACWSAETCDPNGTNEYQTGVDAPSGEGVFDVENKSNPFADYSFVFVPYCTGDVHLGNATTEYTSDLTVHHKGYVNAMAALDHLTETFPDATEVVVIGASAGSVSVPIYADLVADRFPDARVTSIADSSGAYPDTPEFHDILTGSAWGTSDAMGQVPSDLQSAPGLTISAAQRHPDITFARYDHAYDAEQSSKVALASGSDADLLSLIDANEAQIEDAGVNLHSYTAPGDEHVVLADDGFYNEIVDGIALSDWITRLVQGEDVHDVRCTDCSVR